MTATRATKTAAIETLSGSVAKAVKELKAGKIEFRVDKTAIVHVPVGKIQFDEKHGIYRTAPRGKDPMEVVAFGRSRCDGCPSTEPPSTPDALGKLPLGGDELLSKKRVLGDQFDATANEIRGQSENESTKVDYGSSLTPSRG